MNFHAVNQFFIILHTFCTELNSCLIPNVGDGIKILNGIQNAKLHYERYLLQDFKQRSKLGWCNSFHTETCSHSDHQVWKPLQVLIVRCSIYLETNDTNCHISITSWSTCLWSPLKSLYTLLITVMSSRHSLINQVTIFLNKSLDN